MPSKLILGWTGKRPTKCFLNWPKHDTCGSLQVCLLVYWHWRGRKQCGALSPVLLATTRLRQLIAARRAISLRSPRWPVGITTAVTLLTGVPIRAQRLGHLSLPLSTHRRDQRARQASKKRYASGLYYWSAHFQVRLLSQQVFACETSNFSWTLNNSQWKSLFLSSPFWLLWVQFEMILDNCWMCSVSNTILQVWGVGIERHKGTMVGN